MALGISRGQAILNGTIGFESAVDGLQPNTLWGTLNTIISLR